MTAFPRLPVQEISSGQPNLRFVPLPDDRLLNSIASKLPESCCAHHSASRRLLTQACDLEGARLDHQGDVEKLARPVTPAEAILSVRLARSILSHAQNLPAEASREWRGVALALTMMAEPEFHLSHYNSAAMHFLYDDLNGGDENSFRAKEKELRQWAQDRSGAITDKLACLDEESYAGLSADETGLVCREAVRGMSRERLEMLWNAAQNCISTSEICWIFHLAARDECHGRIMQKNPAMPARVAAAMFSVYQRA